MSRLTIQEAIKKVEEMQDDMDSGYRTALIHGAPKDPNYELEIEALGMVIAELQRYKDLEDAGRLIELPCAVGDTVWEIDEYAEGFKARPMTVLSIELKESKGYVYTTYSDEHDNFARGYGFDDFGNILFLTKEKAEAKLAELKGE